MGLSRKQGSTIHETEQFDIRTTVEDFKGSVQYTPLWKPGMDIQVSHIKRRSVPLFVFPGGVRPPPVKVKVKAKPASQVKPSTTLQAVDGASPEKVTEEESKVRQFLSAAGEAEDFESAPVEDSRSEFSRKRERPGEFSGDPTENQPDTKRTPVSLGAEMVDREIVTHVPEAADELEQCEIPLPVKDMEESATVEGKVGASHANVCQTGALEELEVFGPTSLSKT